MRKAQRFLCIFFIIGMFTVLFNGNTAQSVYDAEWKSIYVQDFSSEVNLDKTENTSFFSVKTDGSLNVSSHSICQFTVNSENLSSGENCIGISVAYPNARITRLPQPLEFEGMTYEYTGSGNNTHFIEEIDGKKALKLFTYINAGKYGTSDDKSVVLRTNSPRLSVEDGHFTSEDNSVTVEIECYSTAQNDEDNCLRIYYPNTQGVTKAYTITQQKMREKGDGWVKFVINLTDVDLTKKLGEGNTFKILEDNYSSNVNYIHSFKVYKTPDTSADDVSFTENDKSVSLSFGDRAVVGNVRAKFDVLIPSGDTVSNTIPFNTGSNAIRAGLLDKNKNAALLFEINLNDNRTEADSGRIYVLYGDGDGAENKRLIYTGNLYGRTLSFSAETNREEKTFSAKIFDSGEELFSGEDFTGGLLNSNSYEDIQYFTVIQSGLSHAVMCAADNISIEAQQIMDYSYCAEDCAAIEKLMPKSGADVTENIQLPTIGEIHQSSITWESSNTNAAEIVNGSLLLLKRNEKNENVTIKATVVCGGAVLTREFDYCILGVGKIYSDITADIKKSVSESLAENGTITASLKFNNYKITGRITFAAVVSNKITGEKVGTYTDVKNISTTYQDNSFCIENIVKGENDHTEYYLWDENNVSLRNNAPTDIENILCTAKAKAVHLSWEQSYDDNEATVYEIYRNGVFVKETEECSYIDKSVKQDTNYNYEVKVRDTNRNSANGAVLSAKTKKMLSWNEGTQDGVETVAVTDPERAAYSIKTTVSDSNENTSTCMCAPPSKRSGGGAYAIFFKAPKIGNANDIAVEVTYLDTDGYLNMSYTEIRPDGALESTSYNKNVRLVNSMTNTRTWKTITYVLHGAQFRQSTNMSLADIGFSAGADKYLYIKKIAVIAEEDYE